MFATGVSMYGQMTAGSYCYIGPQVGEEEKKKRRRKRRREKRRKYPVVCVEAMRMERI